MKMKKTLLSSAVIAGLGSPMLANALYQSTDGVGEALLYPYYSAMGGNNTFITVANTTNDAKAVKVRFRDGVGSRDIMDFTLYLSANDYWSGVVYRDGTNTRINTADKSCTVPDVAAAKPAFNPTRIPNTYEGLPDRPATREDRLAEGHLEILEMAVLDPTDDIEFAITHIDGVPADCSTARTWTAGVAQNPFGNASSIAVADGATLTAGGVSQTMLTPTGGLYGHAAVYNPNDGTYFTYQATALRGWAEGPMWFPQNATGLAELAPYTTDDALAIDEGEDPAVAAGLVEYFDLPDLSTPAIVEGTAGAVTYQGSQFVNAPITTGATVTATTFTGALTALDADGIGSDAATAKRDAVTASLMRSGMVNDYVTGQDFETEWVVTFPTRYLHVDFDDAIGSADAPFTVEEDLTTGEACHTVGFEYFDREENQTSDPGSIDFSPGGVAPTAFQLCYEVNVMAINQTSGASTASLQSATVAKYVGLESSYENGWARLDFTDYSLTGNGGNVWSGLPLAGFAAITNTSAAVPRGATFPHHLTDVTVN